MDESAPRAPALSALKAAQASLAESLTRLRVASTAPPPAPSVGEGESLARGMGVLPGEQGEATGGGLSSLFFPGGLGSGVSSRGCTILPSAATGDSFMVIPGLEDQVTSPLSSAQGEPYDGWYGMLRGELPRGSPSGRFRDLRSLRFGDPQDLEGDGFEDSQDFVTKTGGDTAQRSGNTSRLFTASQERGGLCLYGPHNPGTRICGGVIARGAQGQFPDRFCLKTECRFTTHATKSYLPRMIVCQAERYPRVR